MTQADPQGLSLVLAQLEQGGVVAAATESLFGLLVDATRADAIDRLFALKPRADKGMPLLLPFERAWSELVTEIPSAAERLARAFWPGPMTIALPARPDLDPRLVFQGTVAVRLPGSCPAAEIARRFGKPLTATSANPTGQAPTPFAAVVREAFSGAVGDGRLVVLDDAAPGGAPSTVVVVRGDQVEIVRAGAIERAEVERVAQAR
jgi:L-threonylcarbamoyladenylate synthase